jgi:hypothetical protein
MAKIAGVTTKKDIRGKITHVTINTKKHPEAVSKLIELGLMEKSPLQKELETGQFDSVTGCFDFVREEVNKLPWKK